MITIVICMLLLLCRITNSENDTLNLALIQYTYEEHTVKVAPHSNSMKSESYIFVPYVV